jgi:hypothetical protein
MNEEPARGGLFNKYFERFERIEPHVRRNQRGSTGGALLWI